MTQPTKPDSHRAGAVLFILGLLIVLGFGLSKALFDEETPNTVRIGLGVLIAGLLLLFLTVGIQRFSQPDPYKDIEQ